MQSYGQVLEDISNRIKKEERERFKKVSLFLFFLRFFTLICLFRDTPIGAHFFTFKNSNERVRRVVVDDKRERHKRIAQAIVRYSAFVWALVAVLCYVWKPQLQYVRPLAARVVPVVFFPLLPYLLKRLCDWYYVRALAAIDEHLEVLDRTRQENIQNLVESTNYLETKRLIESYQTRDEAAEVEAEISAELQAERAARMPERIMQHPNEELQAFQRTDVAAPVAHRSTLDKLIDYILTDGPNNRYALICGRCYTHNGLVLEEDIGVLYQCRVCGYLNGNIPEHMMQGPPPAADPAQGDGNAAVQGDAAGPSQDDGGAAAAAAPAAGDGADDDGGGLLAAAADDEPAARPSTGLRQRRKKKD